MTDELQTAGTATAPSAGEAAPAATAAAPAPADPPAAPSTASPGTDAVVDATADTPHSLLTRIQDRMREIGLGAEHELLMLVERVKALL